MERCQGRGISATCETFEEWCHHTLPRGVRQGVVARLKMNYAWARLRDGYSKMLPLRCSSGLGQNRTKGLILGVGGGILVGIHLAITL
jgi:hypothetical protein